MRKPGVCQISHLGWGEGETSEKKEKLRRGHSGNVLTMGKKVEQALHKTG